MNVPPEPNAFGPLVVSLAVIVVLILLLNRSTRPWAVGLLVAAFGLSIVSWLIVGLRDRGPNFTTNKSQEAFHTADRAIAKDVTPASKAPKTERSSVPLDVPAAHRAPIG